MHSVTSLLKDVDKINEIRVSLICCNLPYIIAHGEDEAQSKWAPIRERLNSSSNALAEIQKDVLEIIKDIIIIENTIATGEEAQD